MKKNLAIIARPEQTHSRKRWQEEAEKRDVHIVFLNPLTDTVVLKNDNTSLLKEGIIYSESIHAVYRVSDFMSEANRLEDYCIAQGANHLWLNKEQARAAGVGKMNMYLQLAEHHVPIPNSFFVTTREMVESCIQHFAGQYPLIVKAELMKSTKGIGVMLAESEAALKAIIDFSLQIGVAVIVQEYISSGVSGVDYRAVVFDDTVLVGVKRDNSSNDFRSNGYLGSDEALFTLSPQQCDLAIKATKAIGARFSGVDLFGTLDNPIIGEVNSPCFMDMEEKEVNVVGILLDDLLQ